MSIKIDYDEIKGNVQGLTDAAEACVAEEMDPEDTKTTVKDFLNNSELQGQAFENVRIQMEDYSMVHKYWSSNEKQWI